MKCTKLQQMNGEATRKDINYAKLYKLTLSLRNVDISHQKSYNFEFGLALSTAGKLGKYEIVGIRLKCHSL